MELYPRRGGWNRVGDFNVEFYGIQSEKFYQHFSKSIAIYIYTKPEILLADISSLLSKDFVNATDQAIKTVTRYTLVM